jgi:hypothetical protein
VATERTRTPDLRNRASPGRQPSAPKLAGSHNGPVRPKCVIDLIRCQVAEVSLLTAPRRAQRPGEPAGCLRVMPGSNRSNAALYYLALSQTPSCRRPNPTVGSGRHVGSMRATVTKGFALESGGRRSRSCAPRRYEVCSAVSRASRRYATFSTRGLGPRFAKRVV